MTWVENCDKGYVVVCGFAFIWLCPKIYLRYSLCFLFGHCDLPDHPKSSNHDAK